MKMMRLAVICTALIGALPTAQAYARDYQVDYGASMVRFAGTHAGNPFEGKFAEWKADIHFNPDQLDASHIRAEFVTASASTGNAMYDGTLPQSDWFAVKEHPLAVFESSTITAVEDGSYEATGTLTLRDIAQPVTFRFTLTGLEQPPVRAAGKLAIDRLAFDIGKKSDADAAWVSREITIELDITAQPAP